MDTWTPAPLGQAMRHVRASRGWRFIFLISALVVLGYGVAHQLRQPIATLYGSDFYTYYTAALAIRHGADPFTPVATWIASYKPGSPFVASYYVYTPFFALLIVPFTWLSFTTAFAVWGLCNLLFLVGAIYACLRAAGVATTWLRVLALSAAASLLMSIRFEFQWGQADLLVLVCVCVAFWARQEQRPWLAGILLAVACVTKPPLLVFVPFLLWKRELRFALSTIAGFLIMLLTPFLFLGGQTFRDQLIVWQFWSNQYVSFIDNESIKGVLARLFTINPNVQPLIIAPALVTVLWLAIAAILALLTAAMIMPRPLQRDTQSLLEVGLVLTAMLLISPLTEYIYLTVLIVPLVALTLWIEQVNWRVAPYRNALIGTAALWLLLVVPLQHIEYFFWPRMRTPSRIADLYVFLAAPHLYVLLALFALLLSVRGSMMQRSLRASMQAFVGEVRAMMPQRARQTSQNSEPVSRVSHT